MCLIFFSLHTHPRYRIVVAANRDEFYQRPTDPLHFWANDHILAGRDVQAEGTWLGLSRQGRWAFVTNYRDPHNIRPDAPSRGKLVSDFLQANVTPAAYFQSLAPDAATYNGFNLVVGTPTEAWYFSNYGPLPSPVVPGYYGLSNALLETPWPKLIKGKQKLAHVLTANPIEPAAVFQVLYDEERAKDADLPDTGIGLERERALSSMFIKTPVYGTRCSTVLLIDHENCATVVERTYDLQTFSFIDRSFELQLTL